MSAISSTPSPSTTKPIERTKSAPSTPNSSRSKSGTPVDEAVGRARGGDAARGATAASKATDRVRKDPVNDAIIGAVDATRETANNVDTTVRKAAKSVDSGVRKAASDVETGVRKAASDVETGVRKAASDVESGVRKAASDVESGVRRAASDVESGVRKAASDVESGVRKAAKDVEAGVRKTAAKAAEVAKPVLEPTVREVKEAGAEIGVAAAKAASNARDLRNLNSHAEVKAVRDSDLDDVNKNILVTKELIENGIQGGLKTIGSGAGAARETLEGAAETLFHNPFNTTVVEGGKATRDGAKELGSNVGSWIKGRVDSGMEGATRAGKTAAESRNRIEDRVEAQKAENGREIGGAAAELRSNWTKLDPRDHSEVREVLTSDLDDVNKVILVGKELAENGVQGGIRTVSSLGGLGLEVAEAGAENYATNVRNAGEALAGGVEAAGNFLGGVFG